MPAITNPFAKKATGPRRLDDVPEYVKEAGTLDRLMKRRDEARAELSRLEDALGDSRRRSDLALKALALLNESDPQAEQMTGNRHRINELREGIEVLELAIRFQEERLSEAGRRAESKVRETLLLEARPLLIAHAEALVAAVKSAGAVWDFSTAHEVDLPNLGLYKIGRYVGDPNSLVYGYLAELVANEVLTGKEAFLKGTGLADLADRSAMNGLPLARSW